jgi:protein gp37
MSEFTKIQWADTTVNPIMGCGGCELYPNPSEVLAAIAAAMNSADSTIKVSSETVKATFKKLVSEVFLKSENAHPGHKNTVNVTNIWHLRARFHALILNKYGKNIAKAADDAIRKEVTCYAAVQHFNKSASILDREGNRPGKDKPRGLNVGFAPIFESVTRFEGRSAKTAGFDDLLGMSNPKTPWKDRLPRLIFVSDMGDALSAKSDFQHLKNDLMPAILSDDGKRHLWLWLTKRPSRMVAFASEIGGFPDNVCAMTTLTGPDAESLKRLSDLKNVQASIRGLSIEPLWNRIPPGKLNLKGIDWVILGGESGSGDLTRPFAVEWAEELREHCREKGVAFFLKQLGRNPTRDGKNFRLNDKHGGDWNEWDASLMTREFPRAFHEYRKRVMIPTNELRPTKPGKETMDETEFPLTAKDRADFKRLDKIVRQGVSAFVEAGQALSKIHDGCLWRAGEYTTWEGYCREVAGMSKSYVHRLIQASEIAIELSESLPIGNELTQLKPVSESQVRPLARLPEVDQRARAWSVSVGKAQGGNPTAVEVTEAVFEVLNPEGIAEKPEARSAQRVNVARRLGEAIRGRVSWDQLEQLLEELERLL